MTHHYRTKPYLSFREVLKTIAKYAFPPRRVRGSDGKWTDHPNDEHCHGISEYPVIISLENNCVRPLHRPLVACALGLQSL